MLQYVTAWRKSTEYLLSEHNTFFDGAGVIAVSIFQTSIYWMRCDLSPVTLVTKKMEKKLLLTVSEQNHIGDSEVCLWERISWMLMNAASECVIIC